MKKFGKLGALLAGGFVAGGVVAQSEDNDSASRDGVQYKKLDKNKETPPKKIKENENTKKLAALLDKKRLTEKDYAELRVLLEKIVNKSISNKQWSHLKDYIDQERAKKKFFMKKYREKRKRASGTSRETTILSTNPQSHVPILRQQYPDLFGASDYEGENYADEVFYTSNGLKTVDGVSVYEFEYTVVYRDEDSPLADDFYDVVRYYNWEDGKI